MDVSNGGHVQSEPFWLYGNYFYVLFQVQEALDVLLQYIVGYLVTVAITKSAIEYSQCMVMKMHLCATLRVCELYIKCVHAATLYTYNACSSRLHG